MDTQESESEVLRQRSLRRASNIQDVLQHLPQSPTRDTFRHYSPPSPRASTDHDGFSPSFSSWASLATGPPGTYPPSPPPTFPSTTSPFKNKIGQTVNGALQKIQEASRTFGRPSSHSPFSNGSRHVPYSQTFPLDQGSATAPHRQSWSKPESESTCKSSPSVPGSKAGEKANPEYSTPMVPDHVVTSSATGDNEPNESQSKSLNVRPDGPVRSNSTISTSSMMGDVNVPFALTEGTQMTKVTSKKRTKVVVRLNPDMGQIMWEVVQPPGRQRIIPIENIKEMRSGADARYDREQFQLSQVYEDCWLTIIYILDGNYKTLHLIAPTVDIFLMWDATLRKLYAIRRELMSGLGNHQIRLALWVKQYWKGSNLDANERLQFGEVEKLCRRMNIHSGSESLYRLFKEADTKNHGYLDFDDFRGFVKLLRHRPELDRLYKKLIYSSQHAKSGRNSTVSPSKDEGVFDFRTFEYFMREKQQSRLSHSELRVLFNKYATTEGEGESVPIPASGSVPVSRPGSLPSRSVSPTGLNLINGFDGFDGKKPVRGLTMTLDAFTSFLMSADNSAFLDQHGRVWHDMTRPLSDYFVSSSHNTYLVGHQLVGVSTIEGYVRALLHSCRSVEVDIYDGDIEPMVFHGKSFTSKVSLREVCHAIMKYGFITSPYPIIISAEVHCSVPQQDMIAEIAIEVFGDMLVRAAPPGKPKVIVLPSPEELKGRILFKTKDITALRQDSGDSDVFTETSGTSSASDSDAFQDMVDYEAKQLSPLSTVPLVSPIPVSTAKSSFGPSMQAARTVMQKVRHVGRSSSSGNATGSSGGGVGILRVGIAPSPPLRPDTLADTFSPLGPTSVSVLRRKSSTKSGPKPKEPKISPNLRFLMVYTTGVKFQGINKKVDYAPEHMFSLSETTANKVIKTGDGTGMYDLIKHCRAHLVRIYPKGLRVNSTNYEPHRYWSTGAQLVAMNWQTFDLGYIINHAMFQRNGRSGYVLKPAALRSGPGYKELLTQRTSHRLDLTIISAQQLPRPKVLSGKEVVDKPAMDPYVEVTVHVPDWTHSQVGEGTATASNLGSGEVPAGAPSNSLREGGQMTRSGSSVTHNVLRARSLTYRTSVVKNNGFNPVWEEKVRIPFECVGGMWDLVFVKFVVKQEDKEGEDPLGIYCVSLGSLGHGYRHLPLHDAQLSQYLFSTLFVKVEVEDIS